MREKARAMLRARKTRARRARAFCVKGEDSSDRASSDALSPSRSAKEQEEIPKRHEEQRKCKNEPKRREVVAG